MSDDAKVVARDLIGSIKNEQQLTIFAIRLRAWLLTEQKTDQVSVQEFQESRARALLRAASVIDDATLADFSRLVSTSSGARVALHDLLQTGGLAVLGEVRALAVLARQAAEEPAAPASEVPWLSLALSCHAWQRGYPVAQLDPAFPPERFSPAGQVVMHTAGFLRQQVQRSATDRDRIARSLAARTADSPANLDELQPEGAIPPLPPHFRPPIPVRYPEMARETLTVDPNQEQPSAPVARGEALVITEDDLQRGAAEYESQTTEQTPPRRMPSIRISRDQVEPPQQPAPQLPSPMPPSAVVMPTNTAESRPGLTVALRQMFRSEELSSTKLRVLAQEYPDGPGLYGLQVKVTCKGIRSYVAGTTDRDGRFVAELPVRALEGLTYDVDLTWPRQTGGETERKSITLHADRTEFTLPFYVALQGGTQAPEQQSA